MKKWNGFRVLFCLFICLASGLYATPEPEKSTIQDLSAFFAKNPDKLSEFLAGCHQSIRSCGSVSASPFAGLVDQAFTAYLQGTEEPAPLFKGMSLGDESEALEPRIDMVRSFKDCKKLFCPKNATIGKSLCIGDNLFLNTRGCETLLPVRTKECNLREIRGSVEYCPKPGFAYQLFEPQPLFLSEDPDEFTYFGLSTAATLKNPCVCVSASKGFCPDTVTPLPFGAFVQLVNFFEPIDSPNIGIGIIINEFDFTVNFIRPFKSLPTVYVGRRHKNQKDIVGNLLSPQGVFAFKGLSFCLNLANLTLARKVTASSFDVVFFVIQLAIGFFDATNPYTSTLNLAEISELSNSCVNDILANTGFEFFVVGPNF